MNYSLKELCELVGGELVGDPKVTVHEVAEIQNALPGDITFLGNDKYKKYVESTKAEAIIVQKDSEIVYPNLIKVDNPNLAFSICLSKLRPEIHKKSSGIHKSAIIEKKVILGDEIYIGPNVVIEENAIIENGAYIYANCFIGNSARIGANSVILPNVTIYHKCIIGENNLIHSGTVIGSDGFGFVRKDKNIEKIPQTGKVVIGNNVEIGANCSIDRGTIGNTEIGQGTKLDNLVHIAHNVRIGKLCFLAGQIGVAGSAILGDFVTIGGQVGITGHITIGNGVIIGAKSGITKSINDGEFWFGFPAAPYKVKTKEIANIRLIPDMKKRLREIEKIINTKEES